MYKLKALNKIAESGLEIIAENGIVLDDPETIFILLADLLFHPLITGFLFAALLAAVMSTISSQLLVSSSSLTEDFYRLFLRKEAIGPCLDPKQVIDIGESNRRAWILAPGTAWIEGCDVPASWSADVNED